MMNIIWIRNNQENFTCSTTSRIGSAMLRLCSNYVHCIQRLSSTEMLSTSSRTLLQTEQHSSSTFLSDSRYIVLHFILPNWNQTGSRFHIQFPALSHDCQLFGRVVLTSMRIIPRQKANDMRTHHSSMRTYHYRLLDFSPKIEVRVGSWFSPRAFCDSKSFFEGTLIISTYQMTTAILRLCTGRI